MMAILNAQTGMARPRKGLVPIAAGELVESQVLPGHLRDREGHILIPAGVVLNSDDLTMLAGRSIYVGPDWLANRARMAAAPGSNQPVGAAAGENLRQQLRHVWNMTLDLELTEQDGSRRRALRVQTLNLSSGGFAFLHRQFVHPGTRVLAEFSRLPGRPLIEGVVRCCDALGGMEHRVGVQFIASRGRSTTEAED
jgi:hypothetical protein